MRIASIGHAVFASTMIGLGILGLIQGDFTVVWEPLPKWLPARQVLIYLCAFVSLASGIGLLWQRTAAPAARALLAFIVLWLLVFKVPNIFRAPTVEGSYQNCGETAVIAAGAWVLYAWFAADWDRRHLSFAAGEKGVRIARLLYGMSLIAFGLSHFAYVNLTAPLVPAWLPAHEFWAHLTGFTYIAAGAAVLVGVYARLAAMLSMLQMVVFLLLVWVPIVAAGANAFQWSETLYTGALIAGAWVVADSYRSFPWLAVNQR